MAHEERKLTTGEVASMFGVLPRTIREWSRLGKIESTRTLGGDRRFDPKHVRDLLARE